MMWRLLVFISVLLALVISKGFPKVNINEVRYFGLNNDGQFGFLKQGVSSNALIQTNNFYFEKLFQTRYLFAAAARKQDSKLLTWGSGYMGVLGDETDISRNEPILVQGDLTGKTISSFSGGYDHAISLADDGSVFVWGDNSFAQLGPITQNALKRHFSPVEITRALKRYIPGKIIQVAAGYRFSLVLDEHHKVYGWGFNVGPQQYKMLANSTGLFFTQPIPIDGLQDKTVMVIEVGYMHSMALTDDGLVYTWGSDSNYQLARNCSRQNDKDQSAWLSERMNPLPSLVDPTYWNNEKITMVRAGGFFSLALTESGQLYSWGKSSNGETGRCDYPNTICTPHRFDFSNLNFTVDRFLKISAGRDHIVAIVTDTTQGHHHLISWGANNNGQLGNAEWTVTRSCTASEMKLAPYIPNSFVDVMAGHHFTLVVASNYKLYACGKNNIGTFGNGKDAIERNIHIWTPSIQVKAVAVTKFQYFDTYNLVLTNDGEVYYSGLNFVNLDEKIKVAASASKSFNAMFPADKLPTAGTVLEGKIATGICMGDQYAVIMTDKELFTFGINSIGQLGIGNLNSEVPKWPPNKVKNIVLQEDEIFNKVECGLEHTLVHTSVGRVFGWGGNEFNQLCHHNPETAANSKTPVPADKSFFAATTPVEIKIEGGYHISQVETAALFSVLLTKEGKLFHCGRVLNEFGFVYPTLVNLTHVHPDDMAVDGQEEGLRSFIKKVKAGDSHVMFQTGNNNLYSYGMNYMGSVGDGTEEPRISPVLVELDALQGQKQTGTGANNYQFTKNDIVDFDCGNEHSIIITREFAYAWGTAKFGVLGAETYSRFFPTAVRFANGKFLPDTSYNGDNQQVFAGAHQNVILSVPQTNPAFVIAVTGIAGIVVLVTLPPILIICCILFMRKLVIRYRKNKKRSGFANILAEPLLAEEVALNLKINEKLFNIQFEEFTDVKEIASGGSGAIIYKAKWHGMAVAIKLFKTTTLSDERDLSAFIHELELFASLQHVRIVHFFGACLRPPHIGIVTEYCVHGSLVNYMRKNKLKYNKKIDLLTDVARAVHFLHLRGVIHRDLKLDNVLVDENHHAKLSDFGVSTTMQNLKLTRAIGTSVYMSPEVTLGLDYNEKCDVYAFGILMFNLLLETLNPYEFVDDSIESGAVTDGNNSNSKRKISTSGGAILFTSKSTEDSLNAELMSLSDSDSLMTNLDTVDSNATTSTVKSTGSSSSTGKRTYYNIESRVARDPNFRPKFPAHFVIEKFMEPLIQLMQRCWQQDPSQRPSMFDVITILESCFIPEMLNNSNVVQYYTTNSN